MERKHTNFVECAVNLMYLVGENRELSREYVVNGKIGDKIFPRIVKTANGMQFCIVRFTFYCGYTAFKLNDTKVSILKTLPRAMP